MAMLLQNKRLLLDTNVWIAYFLGTESAKQDEATELINACIEARIELYFAATSIKDVFYIVPRELRRMERRGAPETSPDARAAVAWGCVQFMREVAHTATLCEAECSLATMMRSLNGDFEDNMIVAAAETCNADYVVTYDEGLAAAFPAACIKPAQALTVIAVDGIARD
jgi:predicted nucleic acid-binding protein